MQNAAEMGGYNWSNGFFMTRMVFPQGWKPWHLETMLEAPEPMMTFLEVITLIVRQPVLISPWQPSLWILWFVPFGPRFQTMDLSQDGVVSKEEFLQLCQDPTIKSYMTSLDPWLHPCSTLMKSQHFHAIRQYGVQGGWLIWCLSDLQRNVQGEIFTAPKREEAQSLGPWAIRVVLQSFLATGHWLSGQF